MNIRKTDFLKLSLFMMAVFSAGVVGAAQAPNPRSGGATAVSSARGSARDGASAQSTTTARTASRRAGATVSRAAVSHVVTPTTAGRSAVRNTTVSTVARPDMATVRSATPIVQRSATSARSGSTANVSRAATARATAVFDDVSKIGGGYAACREAYSTCMDQFCAKANDTYRRCFCSSKFTEFRDAEDAMDQAKNLLAQFQDNNLNAVDKTAAEVAAMYSATAGEQAIKKDTSAAQSMLNEIGDLLSGKKKATGTSSTSGSLGVLSFDFNDSMDDIWSGTGSDSLFNSSQNQDLALLEGAQLYNSANTQCLKIIAESCENNAVLNMARSSYNILITQDCNAYEKKINSQKESVTQIVREAERILRDARLEEYRAHNSADVNECLDKVRTAIQADTACGANYKKCLDYSGAYIDVNTGDPIYSPRLFKLQEEINLNGGSDVLSTNAKFNQFLDGKRMFATTALNSCRDLADTVWEEFKRSALIEIAQAQDAKIEEVKMSCVSTMADCYDTQSSALKSFDNTTSQYSGAMSAYAARTMCQDKVAACAALYGNGDACKFDNNGKLTNAGSCGLTALLSFVDMVDNVRVAEGCATALENKLKDTCTPASGDMGYPWNCRLRTETELQKMLNDYAGMYCADPVSKNLSAESNNTVTKLREDLLEELDYQLMEVCESKDGFWVGKDDKNTQGTLLKAFYSDVYNGNATNTSLGRCVENNVMVQCLAYNSEGETPIATYDKNKDECVFTDAWYAERCAIIGGYYENSICYVAESNNNTTGAASN